MNSPSTFRIVATFEDRVLEGWEDIYIYIYKNIEDVETRVYEEVVVVDTI